MTWRSENNLWGSAFPFDRVCQAWWPAPLTVSHLTGPETSVLARVISVPLGLHQKPEVFCPSTPSLLPCRFYLLRPHNHAVEK